jgi:hypothetical protein
LAKIRRPSIDAVGEYAEVLVQQHDVGGVLGHVGGRLDRDADVGGVQGDRVVDAIAEEGDVGAAAAGDLDDPGFLVGADPGEHGGVADRGGEGVVVEPFQLGAGVDLLDVQADVAADLAATMGLSPVMTLTVMPRAPSLAIEVPASALGRSMKVRKPSRCRPCSSAALGVVSPGASRVATAMTRAPSANRRARVACASAGTSAQRARTASGAPLVTSSVAPVGVRTATEASWRS